MKKVFDWLYQNSYSILKVGLFLFLIVVAIGFIPIAYIDVIMLLTWPTAAFPTMSLILQGLIGLASLGIFVLVLYLLCKAV